MFAVNFILLQDHSTYFGCCPHPSSGAHKTVTTASGTGHIIVAATFLERGQGHGAPDGHLQRVTIPDAVLIKFDLPMMSTTLLETCRGL